MQHSSDPGAWPWPVLITIKTEVVAILAEFHPPQKQQAFSTSRMIVSATGFVSRGGAEVLALKTGSSNTLV